MVTEAAGLVVDGQRLVERRTRVTVSSGINLPLDGSHVDTREHRRVELVLGRDFKDHLVLACRAVDRRDLARPLKALCSASSTCAKLSP